MTTQEDIYEWMDWNFEHLMKNRTRLPQKIFIPIQKFALFHDRNVKEHWDDTQWCCPVLPKNIPEMQFEDSEL